MQTERTGELSNQVVWRLGHYLRHVAKRSPGSIYVICLTLATIVFAVDVMLPRGATTATGYCAVVVLAASVQRPRFFAALVSLCAALTWLGYAFESPGSAAWMSAFDRVMVTWVLWLTAILCWRREVARAALAAKARELDSASRELRRSNAALERFTSVVAHDLRSPLSSIGLTAEVMGSLAANQSGESAELTCSIKRGVDDMSRMIQGLLAYSRAGHGPLSFSPCDCEQLLSSVLDRLAAPLQAAGGSVTHDPLPMVIADESQLSRVFQNLIENAVKYRGKEPPVVHISARDGENEWAFSVRDHGIGMTSKDAAKIFEMFQRAWKDESRYASAGIGLSVCKTIVERHGGRIWFQSEPGPGTTFWFTLPTQPEALQEADDSAHQRRVETIIAGAKDLPDCQASTHRLTTAQPDK